MSKSLPQRPSLDQLKRQAKDLLKQLRRNEASALVRVKNALPDFETVNDAALSEVSFALSQAQRVVAREYGFASWPKLKQHIEALAEALGLPTSF